MQETKSLHWSVITGGDTHVTKGINQCWE